MNASHPRRYQPFSNRLARVGLATLMRHMRGGLIDPFPLQTLTPSRHQSVAPFTDLVIQLSPQFEAIYERTAHHLVARVGGRAKHGRACSGDSHRSLRTAAALPLHSRGVLRFRRLSNPAQLPQHVLWLSSPRSRRARSGPPLLLGFVMASEANHSRRSGRTTSKPPLTENAPPPARSVKAANRQTL